MGLAQWWWWDTLIGCPWASAAAAYIWIVIKHNLKAKWRAHTLFLGIFFQHGFWWCRWKLVKLPLMIWAWHHCQQSDCLWLWATQTCCLPLINQINSGRCCCLWLVCEFYRCVKVPERRGRDSPGYGAWGEAESETMKQTWWKLRLQLERATLSTDAPFYRGKSCSSHISFINISLLSQVNHLLPQ